MPSALYHVDAFTAEPFRGNPAAVVILDAPVPASWMQAVAADMNLSETAFVARAAGGFDLRWFTPTVEVDLCGHATLAAAHVLWSESIVPGADGIVFSSASGPLTCARDVSGEVRLDFPLDPPSALDLAEAPPALLDGLGARVLKVHRGRFDYLLRVEDERTVRALRPDLGRLAQVEARGVCVTAPADGATDFDFVSRFFAPRVGIEEDPVTGSAHCMLGPYWARELGRDSLRAAQVSPRGGELRVAVEGDRAHLFGNAVTVSRGALIP